VVHHAGLQPDDWKRFVEFPYFTSQWKRYGLDDEALRALELTLVAHPDIGPVIPGTGGLRKVRFARTGGGKSSGFRIGYAYFEEFGIVCLITVYAKNDKEDIPEDQKRTIARMLRQVGDYLARE
jgi:hypothetical protein